MVRSSYISFYRFSKNANRRATTADLSTSTFDLLIVSSYVKVIGLATGIFEAYRQLCHVNVLLVG